MASTVELHFQLALVDEYELVLRGMNVRRHERAGRVVGLECKRGFGPCAIPVGVAEDVPLAAVLPGRYASLKRAWLTAYAHLISPRSARPRARSQSSPDASAREHRMEGSGAARA